MNLKNPYSYGSVWQLRKVYTTSCLCLHQQMNPMRDIHGECCESEAMGGIQPLPESFSKKQPKS